MCELLSAISYSYHCAQKINMTIPSRPAPPPPQAASSASRYTPTTNWDDTPFQNYQSQQISQQQMNGSVKMKRPPPPRPPPPKINTNMPALKKPGQPQSINILSNLFGSTGKRGQNANSKANNNKNSNVSTKLAPPPKIPAPLSQKQTNYGSMAPTQTPTDVQLISFDSPPSSPTFTQKSCSDCISVDSFSSDSNYSSPNNGNISQAESGFEDDFLSQADLKKDPWDLSDPFAMSKIIAPNKLNMGGGTSFYAFNTTIRAPVSTKLNDPDFVDPLCNGKSAVPKVQTVAMPTIIKPTVGQKPQNYPGKIKYMAPSIPSIDDEDFESLPSLPMPNCPPPPPPIDADLGSLNLYSGDADDGGDSFGIALYDYSGEQDDDLSFKANDKIYLIKRLNDEWLYGRDKRGCEGMFPANFIEIKTPIGTQQKQQPNAGDISRSSSRSPQIRVLYNFIAETADDLTLMENDIVTVLYEITPEWLYGEVNNKQGQFPSNFIETIPKNLPQMPSKIN